MRGMKAIKPPIDKAERRARREAQKRASRAAPPSPKPQSLSERLGGWWRSWRRSTRNAEARATPKPAPPPSSSASSKRRGHAGEGGQLQITFPPLEIALAHDGALRGLADPTLLLAVFGIDDRRQRLLPVLRSVVRYQLPGAAPCSALPDVHNVVSTVLRGCQRALVVASLWEENSGVDVRALASALERPDELHLVDLHGVTPEVHTALDAVGLPSASPAPLAGLSARGILVDHGDVARTQSDTWVGGAAVVVALNHWRTVEHRIALRSTDGRQDWTLQFATRRV
jgi:hypothetical protein